MAEEEPAMSMGDIERAIPQNYQLMKCLRSGSYGKVVECQKIDTREVVAVKLPIRKRDSEKEICLLQCLMDRGADQRHIVKFLGTFNTPVGQSVIFEKLDMDLSDYWCTYNTVPLSDIRTIIKQVAVALEVLKDMSIIHADLKMENAMVPNHAERPIHVKLIDFGHEYP